MPVSEASGKDKLYTYFQRCTSTEYPSSGCARAGLGRLAHCAFNRYPLCPVSLHGLSGPSGPVTGCPVFKRGWLARADVCKTPERQGRQRCNTSPGETTGQARQNGPAVLRTLHRHTDRDGRAVLACRQALQCQNGLPEDIAGVCPGGVTLRGSGAMLSLRGLWGCRAVLPCASAKTGPLGTA